MAMMLHCSLVSSILLSLALLQSLPLLSSFVMQRLCRASQSIVKRQSNIATHSPRKLYNTCISVYATAYNRYDYFSSGDRCKLPNFKRGKHSITIQCSRDGHAAQPPTDAVTTVRRRCETAEDLEDLGDLLATVTTNGDVLLMLGDLGAGKTTFSRGLIRAKHGDPDMRVTSPSYLLDNTYNLGDELIHHIDLYRLPTGSDLSILGIPGIFENSLCIIEWPQRMAGQLPASYLEVSITTGGVSDDQRIVQFSTSCAKWKEKLKQIFPEL